MRNRSRERGNQTVEFTMLGIPLVFILFSIANMSFGMLTMHTMQEAVEQAARFAATRGSTCSSGTNTCTVTVQQIAGAVASLAAGVSASKLSVTLTPAADTGNAITCNPLTACLSSCSSGCSGSRTTVWPTSTNGDNSPGKDIIVSADCTVNAPIFMFWGGGSGSGSEKEKSTSFHAYSRQRLMF
jgi:Flp pilus assembly protein TadG